MTRTGRRGLDVGRNNHLELPLDLVDESSELGRGADPGEFGVRRESHFRLERNMVLMMVELGKT